MNWFLNLSTRGKLFLGVGTMLAIMTAVMLTAYLGISAMQESQQNLYKEDFANAVRAPFWWLSIFIKSTALAKSSL